MPYGRHPSAQEPDDPDTIIWRYMDVTKLISLLETERLFFPRLSALEDQHEGILTRPVFDKIMAVPEDADQHGFVEHMKKAGHAIGTFRMGRDLLFVSSWHMNSYESAAMWRLYLKSDEGVAVRSTFGRFRDSIRDSRQVSIGKVRYIDYERDEIDWTNIFNLGLHKRLSFEHERELRGILMDGTVEGRGTSVPVHLDTLIEEVYVAPTSPTWLRDLLAAVLDRYGLPREVRKSRLGEDPLY